MSSIAQPGAASVTGEAVQEEQDETAPESRGDLVMLCHRIPYPPDKGDKIRAYNMLKHLVAAGWRVHLGALVDDEADLAHEEVLQEDCASVMLVPISSRRAKLKSVSGILRGTSMSVEYFRHSALQGWFDTVLNERPVQAVFCVCAPMAEYVFRNPAIASATATGRPRLLLDFMDVDSEKWREYAASGFSPMRLVYAVESLLLRRYEALVAKRFDAVMLVSEAEADVFLTAVLPPGTSCTLNNVYSVTNGVDTEFFVPQPVVCNHNTVFCGAMDYLPNIDAVEWFATSVLPLVRHRYPDATFTIVGSKPADRVKQLADLPGVTVTGKVHDVRPYVYEAALSVVPLRIARGVQNKVLEAMSMGRPVLATPEALSGIMAKRGRDVLCARAEAVEFADAIHQFFSSPEHAVELGTQARRAVVESYTWERCLQNLNALISS